MAFGKRNAATGVREAAPTVPGATPAEHPAEVHVRSDGTGGVTMLWDTKDEAASAAARAMLERMLKG